MRNPRWVALFATMSVIACGDEAGPRATGDLRIVSPQPGTPLIAGTRAVVEWEAASDVEINLWLTGPSAGDLALGEALPTEAGRGSLTWEVPLIVPEDGRPFSLEIAPATTEEDATDTVPVQTGSFAAFRWNEAAEIGEYYWIDLSTGEATEALGTVGDLYNWQRTPQMDDASHTIYVVGETRAGETKLYGIDAYSGALSSSLEVGADFPYAYIVGASGRLLGFRYDETTDRETIVDIDPSTGDEAALGVATWRNRRSEFAFDRARGRAYVLANEADGAVPELHTLDLENGAAIASTALRRTDGVDIDDTIAGLAATSTGGLVTFQWNGTAEETMTVDPVTGDCTPVGTVGDLKNWQAGAAVRAPSDELYVIGSPSEVIDGNEPLKLYVLDGQTGAFEYDVPIAEWPIVPPFLVY